MDGQGRVDQPVNPRRGLVVETHLEQGRKERSLQVVTAAQETTTERTRLRQERLQVRGRLFVPTWRRQVVALGGEAALLRSNAYDQSDLFRFGGATSLAIFCNATSGMTRLSRPRWTGRKYPITV